MFSNGITQCFKKRQMSKTANYLDYLDLAKIRLAIMLSDFAEKKETFLTINNIIFQSKKVAFFFKGVNLCFWPKNSKFIWSK